MHPAYSVILFTTATGAGYGLIALLAIFVLAGLLPVTTWLGVASLGAALTLVFGGLMSSVFHLGRPERALGALTQWRSSWLAREGVAAIATFAPVALFGIGWVFLNDAGGFYGWMGVASAVMALVTVSCTAMIYASLKTIRQWCNAFVLPTYLVLGLATGSLLLVFLALLFDVYRPAFAVLALILLCIGWALKWRYWRHIGTTAAQNSLATATGLGRLGAVRLLEMPQTEENFLMREMGYQVARAHTKKLRALVHITLFAVPLSLMVLILAALPPFAWSLAMLSVTSAAHGVLTERWLFFAEARHVSMIYYGRPA